MSAVSRACLEKCALFKRVKVPLRAFGAFCEASTVLAWNVGCLAVCVGRTEKALE